MISVIAPEIWSLTVSNPVRKDVLRLLSQLSDEASEVPIGQLIAKVATLACGPTREAIWEVSDDDLLEATREYLDRYRITHATTPYRSARPDPASQGIRLSG